jgi:tyrosine-protein kinase Etk/Wzc
LVILLPVVVAGGAYFAGRDAVPRYQSHLTVQVSSSKQVFARGDDIDVDELALKTDPILSEALVLTTQALARRVVDTLALEIEIQDPRIHRGVVLADPAVAPDAPSAAYELTRHSEPAEWAVTDAGGNRIASGGYFDRAAGPGFSFVVLPPSAGSQSVRFWIVSPDQAAAWVRGGISYRVRPETNAVDVSFTGTDPTLVPLVLNQAAVQLRGDGVDRSRVAAERRREYIAEQLARAEIASREKLQELQQYKEAQQITNLSTEEEALAGQISQFEQERQRIRLTTTTLADLLEDSSMGIQTLNEIAAVEGLQSNTALGFQIDRLLQLYEERRTLTTGALALNTDNPQVRGVDQRIEQGHRALRSAVTAALTSYRGREAAVEDKIAELRGELASFPGKETRIAQLQLESSILEGTYRYLLGQFQQAQLQEATITPYVNILDGATPAYAIGTNLRQKIVIGLLVGLLLGLAGAFFLEYLDQTIKDASDIERTVGVPVLGRIPLEARLQSAGNGRRQPIVAITQLAPDDPAVEAFRTLRTNVTFVGADRPVQVVAVTSPGPGEGKSTTAANLALTLALGGGRTLLVDGDLRRPQIHRVFGLVEQPGLTDVLVGRASTREAVRPEVAPRLDMLPAGVTPPNPAELLGSDSMRELLTGLRREYEHIVIDTPPSLPVTDATVVAAVADATILVMRSGETEEVAAQRAVEQLERVRARIAGTVLNGVSPRKDRYYSYYTSDSSGARRSRRPRRSLKSRIAALI